MKFHYVFDSGKYLPIIPLRLKGRNEWVEFKAYIDTGASFSLFHADVAEVLGLVLEQGEKREMVLGDGDCIEVYVHKIPVHLAGVEFVASIGFSKNLNIHLFVMGREDIFTKFIISFDEQEKTIEFIPKEK